MSLTFKLLSLAIRTAAKPIGNYIKRQTKEHDGFRKFAVAQAQRVHRIDMRMRLGILHDPAAQERMHEREQRAAEELKRKSEPATVRTEEEQRIYEEEQARAKDPANKPKEEKSAQPKIKIRPLSEAKAIELGANFFSEAFIFAVAAGLLIWDSWRSRRKESNRRDMVADRLDSLEVEVERLRGKYEPDAVYVKETSEKGEQDATAWYNPAGWWMKTQTQTPQKEVNDIQGNVPGTKVIQVVEEEKKNETAPPKAKAKPESSQTSAQQPAAIEEAGNNRTKLATRAADTIKHDSKNNIHKVS